MLMNDARPLPSESIRLTIRNLGHVPAFKNSKIIRRPWGKNGKPIIATKDEYKKWMEQVILSIASQLSSAYRINGGETATALSLPSWIASSLPLDDSRQWIPCMAVNALDVPPGEEGADILITRMTEISLEEATAIYARAHDEVMLESGTL
jgi:hypothetical protein